jgi:hypothetical protein
MGAGSFPGVKRSGRSVDHPLLYSTEVKESLELFQLWDFVASYWVTFTLPLPLLPCNYGPHCNVYNNFQSKLPISNKTEVG